MVEALYWIGDSSLPCKNTSVNSNLAFVMKLLNHSNEILPVADYSQIPLTIEYANL